MNAVGTCPKCGSGLPANAPVGICPACLLQAGLSGEPSPDDSPGYAATALTAGFVPPTPEELSRYFPQLEILELLGKGGMGAVYKARQPRLDRFVAVKILPPEVGSNPSFAERFTREARALAKLSHQNIVSVFDFGQADGQFYFIMEYVDGANLRHLMSEGALQPSAALAMVQQICEALQFAHNEGIVHRDIKPENILVDTKGRVKIADFGLARLVGSAPGDVTLTGTHQVMGTPRYMAPEQMEGSHAVDHRADIFSLGVVFYEMLTGEVPMGHFDPPSKKADIDAGLDEVVMRALAREPERRFQQASEMGTRVSAIGSKATSAGRDRDDSEIPPGPSTILEERVGGLFGATRRGPAQGAGSDRTERSVTADRHRPTHVTVLGVLHIAMSAVGLLVGLIVFISVTGGGVISQDPTAMKITAIVGTSIAAAFTIFSLPGIIVGFGLLRMRPWARILAMVLAVVNAVNVPVGTIVAVYTFWVLLNEENAAVFTDRPGEALR